VAVWRGVYVLCMSVCVDVCSFIRLVVSLSLLPSLSHVLSLHLTTHPSDRVSRLLPCEDNSAATTLPPPPLRPSVTDIHTSDPGLRSLLTQAFASVLDMRILKKFHHQMHSGGSYGQRDSFDSRCVTAARIH
jgi:hypothetical protein